MDPRGSGGKLALAAIASIVVGGSYWLFRRASVKRDETPKRNASLPAPTDHSETKVPEIGFRARGSRVSTPWGNGTVVDYRSEDQTYQVSLELDDSTATVFCQSDSLVPFQPRYKIGERVATPVGEGVVENYRDEDQIYAIRHSWDDQGSAYSYLTSVSVWPLKPKFVTGDLVQTPVGPGTVVDYRPEDGIFEVELKFDDQGGARAYVSGDSVETLRRPYVSLAKLISGSQVQTPFGAGTVRDFREEDQIYEVELNFDDHGSASAFIPAEVLEISSPTYETGDHVETPAGPGVVQHIIYPDFTPEGPSYQIELEGKHEATFHWRQLSRSEHQSSAERILPPSNSHLPPTATPVPEKTDAEEEDEEEGDEEGDEEEEVESSESYRK